MSDAAGAVSAGGAGASNDVSAPPPALDPDQQSDALTSRIEARRAKAEGRDQSGRFLPKKKDAPADVDFGEAKQAAKVDAEKPKGPEKEAPTEDPAVAKLKSDLDKYSKDIEALKAKDAEWTSVAEQALARIDTQKAYIEKLEAALAEKGGSIDPRDIEIARYQERARAQELAEERAKAEAEAKAQSAAEEKTANAKAALVAATNAALEKVPELRDPKNQKHLVSYLRLVHRGGDPAEMADLVGAQIRTAKPSSPMAPKTLIGSGSGSGGPKLKDPRDIADKWKARLGAA